MRILLDTNVLVAAFVSRGVCSVLLEHCSEAHHLVTSDGLLEEYREKLSGKFRMSAEAADERIAFLRSIIQLVPTEPLPAPVCRDPDDDLVLATAVAGECGCIITGDNDLLVLKQYAGIDIIAPGDFARYERETG
ncbi:putative toxin-antitoxin system toxin component, PIN family [Longimicrobium sp.]|uniref:putative toxin-antitoxin system toxin component, PIN family n=1 Tax=Longimicrobium sp. TaxID=2029185 RepID=UPI002E335CF6|nr:putative toxin-antitoxin system toxin component, PIN family [Longimicrobium sp.]HEX6040908.1 putative toxin-antitoxin system toxin component, PIN family [Longimicrobium sp.]